MNQHETNDQDQSTILKLNQFVPGQPRVGANNSDSPETVTGMIVRQDKAAFIDNMSKEQ